MLYEILWKVPRQQSHLQLNSAFTRRMLSHDQPFEFLLLADERRRLPQALKIFLVLELTGDYT